MTLKIKGKDEEKFDLIELRKVTFGVYVVINNAFALYISDDGKIYKDSELIGRWKE